MNKLPYLLVLSGFFGAPALAADAPASPHTLTGNIAVTTDYVFRGVSQTQGGPALQGGFDYSHASGFYLGVWGSNVEWVSTGYKDNNSLELDLYGGYKGALGEIGYDIGAITYYYPGDQVSGANDPDTTEVYLGLSWKTLSLKYNYTVSDHFVGWGTSSKPSGKTDGSYYVDLSGTYDLGDGWGLLGHVGYQDVKDNDDASYTDWKIGVSKDVGFGVFTLAYSDTDADKKAYTWTDGSHKEEVAESRVFLTFSKSF
jgi:uncharacterized protein (TIGR02001 family)